MTGQNVFVHLLLFRCPGCARPIPAAITSDQGNLEQIDAMPVVIQCNCNWKGSPMVASARKHLVEPWE